MSISVLKNISPENIEDLSERYLPLFTDSKDSDTVKKISIKGNELFVIGILEHESEVNYASAFKLLRYTTLVLSEYVKDNDRRYYEEKKQSGNTELTLSTAKEFRYPPVIPIIFYDGPGAWTSETNFFDKTEMNGIFEKYIPKFEYELVNLNDYSQDDLVVFDNALSLLLIIDKVRKAEDIEKLKKLPEQFIEGMAKKVPEHFLKIFRDCVELLLMRINVPEKEIGQIADKIYERRFNAMFHVIDGYDVQATRRQARQEAIREAKEQYQAEKKQHQAEKKQYQAEKKQYENEIKKLMAEIEELKKHMN